MAASGVIAISAQIVESTDIGGKQKATPDMSLLQRITASFQNMRKDWKKLVGNKATGLFYALLASSKIVQGVVGQTFRMFVALLELMMPIFIPTLVWIIQNLANLVDTVKNVISGITESFKEVFSVAWEAVKTAIEATWGGVEWLFGLSEKVDVQDKVDKFYDDRIIGSPLTQKELERWGRQANGGLIQGGPIKPEDWNEEPKPSKGTYLKEDRIDEGYDDPANQGVSWLYADGESSPPGGKLDSDTTSDLIDSGDIRVIDTEYDDEDGESFHDQFFGWTDTIVPFGWEDITSWVGDGLTENVTWENIFMLFLGSYSKNAASSEDILMNVIDKGAKDEASVSGGGYDHTKYPRAADVHDNPFYYEELWNDQMNYWMDRADR